jgi:hypothetical protein
MPLPVSKNSTSQTTYNNHNQLETSFASFLPSKKKSLPRSRPGLLAYVRPTCPVEQAAFGTTSEGCAKFTRACRAFPICSTDQWHTYGFRPDYSRGAAGAFHSLPFGRNQKKPRTGDNRSGDCPFLSSNRFRVHTPAREVCGTLRFSWQVFWLPRPSSDLPIPVHRNSGTNMLKEFPFLQRKGRGYSGGPAPEFNGIPY